MNKEYVVKSNRLKEFLYCLGFHYREVPNKYVLNDFVYLFPQTDKLLEAITFYTQFHNNRK